MSAPTELWTAAQSEACDRHTIDTLGVPSQVLMERAALAVAAEIEARRASSGLRVLVLVGPGNNGGDGLAIARQLTTRGGGATAVLCTDARNQACAEQLKLARSHGVTVMGGLPPDPGEPVYVVDALLGTGSEGAPRGGVAEALRFSAGLSGLRMAVDIPTGVEPDTGRIHEGAFDADATVTFARSKVGLHVTPGRDHAGDVVIADIGLVPPPGLRAEAELIDPFWVRDRIGGLSGGAHKGERGHVGIIGGSSGTPGAAVLAGAAALRTGAGVATICASDAQVQAQIIEHRPELMVVAPDGGPPVHAAATLVVGPGLTAAADRERLANLYRDDPRPAVWDASALEELPIDVAPGGPRVITPHAGEAARMLARTGEPWTSSKVQDDRLTAAHRLAELTGVVVVLKGAGTLVVSGSDTLAVCVAGGSELATAGTGDCLAGAIGALLARGLDVEAAARVGVHVHAAAGELCPGPGTLAMDVAERIPDAMRSAIVPQRWPAVRRM